MSKALLLEDEECCRNIMIEILNDCDIEVEAYQDPSLYFKQNAKCPRVDIILTDNQMPNMTGLAFLQRIEEMKCDIPANNKALISGSLTREDLDKISKLGVKYFNKPCSINEIYAWLKEIDIISKP